MEGERTFTFRTLLRYALQGALLGILALAAVFWFTLSPETIRQIHSFNWFFMAVPIFLVIGSWTCNAARTWNLSRALGRPLSMKRSLGICLSGEFGVSASPAGMGGPVLRLALMNRSGISLSTAATLYAADMATDAAFLVLAVPTALLILFRTPAWSPLVNTTNLIHLSLALAALLLVVGTFFLLFRRVRWMRHLRESHHWNTLNARHRLGARLRAFRWKLRRGFRRSWRAWRFMLSRRRGALFLNLCFSALQWGLRYSVLPVIAAYFLGPSHFLPLMVVQAVLFGLSMAVVIPGGGGGVELATPLVLQYFVPAPLIPLVLLLWRFCTYHLYLFTGGLVLFFMTARKP